MGEQPATNGLVHAGLVRAGLAVLLAIPVACVILAVLSMISCVMVGPWGGLLDGVDTSREGAKPNTALTTALHVSLLLGPVFIGWRWAGRILRRDNRPTK